MTDNNDNRGAAWVFYDGHCAFCRGWIRRLMPSLKRYGFRAAALQEPWAGERLNRAEQERMKELRVITQTGAVLGGADAFVYLARFVSWLWPVWIVSYLPGAMCTMRRAYAWVARRRGCLGGGCPVDSGSLHERERP